MSSEHENPRKWLFTWEAQSHIPALRLFLFNRNVEPSTKCKSLNVKLELEQSLLAVNWFEEDRKVSLRVPIPRVLVDVEAPVSFRALEDHIDVKIILLLPVDHPILRNLEDKSNHESEFIQEDGFSDYFQPLSMDSELKTLSSGDEIHFYCRKCSAELTRPLRFFVEMPSVNWREAADNWFGACCCSFGGISEKLVTKYANSYTCAAGTCLLSTAFIIICKDDLVGCKLPFWDGSQKDEPKADTTHDNYLAKDNGGDTARESERKNESNGKFSYLHPHKDNHAAQQECDIFERVANADGVSCMFKALKLAEDVASIPGCCGDTASHAISHDTDGYSFDMPENIRLLANQRSFLNGFLENIFMVRSSNLSYDVQWIEIFCPQCLCLLGAYPCGDGNAPLDGGIRLFKCYISTCLPVGGTNDLFRKYALERMFSNRLSESAKDELSFRTLVRDLQTRSPMLQIVLLNPNSWYYTGYCSGTINNIGPVAKIDLYPAMKVLFSDCSGCGEFQSRRMEEWLRKNQADEVYMLEHQIRELTGSLESAKDILPSSYGSLQGLSLSFLRR